MYTVFSVATSKIDSKTMIKVKLRDKRRKVYKCYGETMRKVSDKFIVKVIRQELKCKKDDIIWPSHIIRGYL